MTSLTRIKYQGWGAQNNLSRGARLSLNVFRGGDFNFCTTLFVFVVAANTCSVIMNCLNSFTYEKAIVYFSHQSNLMVSVLSD